MSEMYSVIGTKLYDNLLADPQGADVIAIPCEPGKGELKAGTLMYRGATGLYAPASSSEISTSYYLAVLKEDIDTGNSVDIDTVAENAAAYRAGCFVDGKVTYDSSGTATAVTAAQKVVLRLMGIVFDVIDGADNTFNNGTVTITYKANNSVTPAEDDVKIAALTGSTYTILNNSDSKLGFTAPATKSFSKWNTKADGSGTDYAAAATYTADEDLTLYAVWA
jgi:Listeria-Bacteroides repeat domain (List_Bact_rpt).